MFFSFPSALLRFVGKDARPDMRRTILLPREQWSLVEPIVQEDLKGVMPDQAGPVDFLVAMDGKTLAGFIQVETVYHFRSVYVAPEYRNSSLAIKLMKEADSLVPSGFSAIVMVNKARVGKLLRAFGGRELDTQKVFRKDY
jgi:hypothetical protein